MPLLIGIALGTLAALPLVAVLRRGRPRVAAGVVAVMASFALFHAVVLLVRAHDLAALVPTATTAALTFLALVTTAALRR